MLVWKTAQQQFCDLLVKGSLCTRGWTAEDSHSCFVSFLLCHIIWSCVVVCHDSPFLEAHFILTCSDSEYFYLLQRSSSVESCHSKHFFNIRRRQSILFVIVLCHFIFIMVLKDTRNLFREAYLSCYSEMTSPSNCPLV